MCLLLTPFPQQQFNDTEDLKNYPRTPAEDIGMLMNVMRKNDIVFLPPDKEIYPEKNDVD